MARYLTKKHAAYRGKLEGRVRKESWTLPPHMKR